MSIRPYPLEGISLESKVIKGCAKLTCFLEMALALQMKTVSAYTHMTMATGNRMAAMISTVWSVPCKTHACLYHTIDRAQKHINDFFFRSINLQHQPPSLTHPQQNGSTPLLTMQGVQMYSQRVSED